MNDETQNKIAEYLDNPFGALHFDCIQVGRYKFAGVIAQGREAAIHLRELFQLACEKARRVRRSSNDTRYPEPLPMGTPARLLSVEIDDYLKDMQRRNLTTSTIKATGRSLKLLMIACGDIPVSRIDHKHIYTLWDLLRWAPKYVVSDPHLSKLSAESLIARGKADGVPSPAIATFELQRRFLVSFFGTLVKARAIAFSPMDAFREMKKDLMEDEDAPERIFSTEDLKSIFNPEIFVPWAEKFPHRWWAPMIGLYTGARVNEVAQLKVKDVILENGIWCLWFRKTADADLDASHKVRSRQKLKGKSAVRMVPIAQPLITAGFLDYLEDVRASGHPRLFPHLTAGSTNRETGEFNGRYSRSLIKQFGEYLKQLGFSKGVGFHAFRHSFVTELENEGVRVEEIALITGHTTAAKVPVLEGSYVHKTPDRVRARQLKVLSMYQPPVQLPVYSKGQFAARLRQGAKTHS